jgi:hypothetical protein
MKMRIYLLIAFVAFVVAVTGSNMIAHMTIAEESFGEAFGQHLQWVSETSLGVVFLFAPFGVSALICGLTNKSTKTRTIATIFCASIAVLSYFYFQGFQASEHAMRDKRWTAAALSIGLLPFFIGIPLLVVLTIAAAIAARVDRRAAM